MKDAHNLTEKEWEARWDAETLARAEMIKADKTRYDAAVKAAQDMVAEEEAQAKAMKSVANA